MIDDLGRGAYGKVKLAVDEANCPVAIKIVHKSLLKKTKGDSCIAREIAVMKKLKHRNVVPLYEVIDDPESEKLYMVMKYVDQGPITKLQPGGTCETIGAERLREVLGELVSGLSYLHKRGVAHRDIKPDNILVDAAGTPYFVDFGVSAIIDRNNPNVSTVEGTATFMPPELFDDQALKVDAFAADVWSLGVTVYMLLYGKVPFGGSNYREIATAVRTEELVFPARADSGVGDGWEDLLRGMLCKDAAKRMKLKAVKKHSVLQEAPVTAAEVEMAMSKVANFLSSEEPLSPKFSNFCRSVRRSSVGVPQCIRRSVRSEDSSLSTHHSFLMSATGAHVDQVVDSREGAAGLDLAMAVGGTEAYLVHITSSPVPAEKQAQDHQDQEMERLHNASGTVAFSSSSLDGGQTLKGEPVVSNASETVATQTTEHIPHPPWATAEGVKAAHTPAHHFSPAHAAAPQRATDDVIPSAPLHTQKMSS